MSFDTRGRSATNSRLWASGVSSPSGEGQRPELLELGYNARVGDGPAQGPVQCVDHLLGVGQHGRGSARAAC